LKIPCSGNEGSFRCSLSRAPLSAGSGSVSSLTFSHPCLGAFVFPTRRRLPSCLFLRESKNLSFIHIHSRHTPPLTNVGRTFCSAMHAPSSDDCTSRGVGRFSCRNFFGAFDSFFSLASAMARLFSACRTHPVEPRQCLFRVSALRFSRK